MLSLLFVINLNDYIPSFTSSMHSTILIISSIVLSLLIRPNLLIRVVGLKLKHRLRLIISF
jgi:hypothetical protein